MSEAKISLALAFIKADPERVAQILEQHNPKDVASFIVSIPHSYASPVLQSMLPKQAAKLGEILEAETIAGILTNLPASRIVAILRLLSKSKRVAIIQELPTKVEINCALLLNYSREMVGAWMTPHVFTIPYACTIAEANAYTKGGDSYTYTDYVFVVERDGELKGRIRLSELLTASPNTYVSSMIEVCRHTLSARSLIYSINQHSEWYDEEAIPVLDKQKRIVGVLRHLDLRKYQDKPFDRSAVQNPEDAPLTGLLQIYMHSLKALMFSMKDCIETDIRS